MAKHTALEPPNLRRRPSLRSLAKELGISHNTVALALKDDPRVAPALRKKIQRKAEAEAYLASDLTRSLVTGRSNTIGVVLTSFNYPSSAHAAGISSAAVDASLVPIMLSSDLRRDREEDQLGRLARLRVDGIILSPSWEGSGEQHHAEVLARRIPMVAINRPVPLLNLPEVGSDNVAAGRLAASHLLEHGHRRMVCIDSPAESALRRPGRAKTFVETCRQAGAQVKLLRLQERNNEASEIPALLDSALRGSPLKQPTAMFCHNDYVALAVYAAARDRGLHIPNDLSLIGCGNVGVAHSLHFLDFLNPPLTTIEQTAEQVGRKAFEILHDLIEGRSVAPHTVIPPILIKRGSVTTPAS